jgi:hypothetical protein
MSNKAAAILAGAALLVGGLIGRASADTGNASKPKPGQITGQALDPRAYPRTKSGAVTAAQAYNDAFFRAALMPDDQRTVVETISSDAMRAQIVNEETEAAQAAATIFDLPKERAKVVGRMTPIGYRVVSFSTDSARVEIWTLMLLGNPGVGHGIPPQFRTATVDLTWEREAWRLTGTPQGKDGPAPVADNPDAGNDVVAAVKDFQEYSHAAN